MIAHMCNANVISPDVRGDFMVTGRLSLLKFTIKPQSEPGLISIGIITKG